MKVCSSILCVSALAAGLVSTLARANDAASAVGAGGVVLRDERRISMQKERLEIRFLGETAAGTPLAAVEVEYAFLNESAEDVTTEVAFPVPEYREHSEALGGPMDLGGFRAWVDGKEIRVEKQVRALVDGKDHAAVLSKLGVDIENHGQFRPDDSPNQLSRLGASDARQLIALGLIDEERWPRWKVAITWHWTQTFPAGKIIRVRHAYTPAAGFSYSGDIREYVRSLPDACADEAQIRVLEARRSKMSKASGGTTPAIFGMWVDYILTTANTWKTPIRDFELVVERPEGHTVSFCWDGKVEKVSARSFSAKAKDFIPKRELAVYFFWIR